jgi:uncharacterized protein YdiU (UPF0061 family)
MSLLFPFENAYAQLPAQCFSKALPTPVKKPQLIRFNEALARTLNIDFSNVTDDELAAVFSGNETPENSEPLAMAYSGHQFGNLNPQLGDGRAILLGDLIDVRGQLMDVQLKGAGRTAYSRGGDGRSPMGPALREYILCEAMTALGVPTTRALAVVASGELVVRQQREPGAVFTRVASSHIRVGTFQYFALHRDEEGLTALADHVIERHYSEIDSAADDRYLQMFKAICKAQADLIAHWMLLGFIHGVMNTDNMTVSGETIDYGPCAFIDAFSMNKKFSSIDQQARYAYNNQPAIGQWNLARLAESLLGLFPGDEKEAVAAAKEILGDYSLWHHAAWQTGMNKKLGFSSVVDTNKYGTENDKAFSERLLKILDDGRLDFTLFFRRLSDVSDQGSSADRTALLALADDPEARKSESLFAELNAWLDEWQARLSEREVDLMAVKTRMYAANPAIIPRNHRVAEAIAAAEAGDYTVFDKLLSAVEQPYVSRPEFAEYEQGPQPEEKVLRTFCGT